MLKRHTRSAAKKKTNYYFGYCLLFDTALLFRCESETSRIAATGNSPRNLSVISAVSLLDSSMVFGAVCADIRGLWPSKPSERSLFYNDIDDKGFLNEVKFGNGWMKGLSGGVRMIWTVNDFDKIRIASGFVTKKLIHIRTTSVLEHFVCKNVLWSLQ